VKNKTLRGAGYLHKVIDTLILKLDPNMSWKERFSKDLEDRNKREQDYDIFFDACMYL
jgi:hypothetical protein